MLKYIVEKSFSIITNDNYIIKNKKKLLERIERYETSIQNLKAQGEKDFKEFSCKLNQLDTDINNLKKTNSSLLEQLSFSQNNIEELKSINEEICLEIDDVKKSMGQQKEISRQFSLENNKLKQSILNLAKDNEKVKSENNKLYEQLQKEKKECIATLELKDAAYEKLSENYRNLETKSINYVYPLPTLDNFERYLPEKSRNRKILLLGWFGANNFGDELMLKVVLDELLQQSNNQISVIIDRSERYSRKYPDKVNYFYPPEEMTSLQKIANYFDSFIIAGGAHIDDREINSLSFTPHLAILLSNEFIHQKKEVRWRSVSSNDSLNRADYLQALNSIILGSTEFSLRDTNSFQTLKNSGLEMSKVTLTTDLAYSYPYDSKRLIITLMPINEEQMKELSIILAEAIKTSKKKWLVNLLPFCLQHDYDLPILNKFADLLKIHNIETEVLPKIANEEAVVTLFKGSDAFINMRYHASLISLRLNKPTVSIVWDDHPHYRNKMNYLYRDKKVEKNIIDSWKLLPKFRDEQLAILCSLLDSNI